MFLDIYKHILFELSKNEFFIFILITKPFILKKYFFYCKKFKSKFKGTAIYVLNEKD